LKGGYCILISQAPAAADVSAVSLVTLLLLCCCAAAAETAADTSLKLSAAPLLQPAVCAVGCGTVSSSSLLKLRAQQSRDK